MFKAKVTLQIFNIFQNCLYKIGENYLKVGTYEFIVLIHFYNKIHLTIFHSLKSTNKNR